MDLEIQIALLGILGTMGGTILGWILNNLSKHGKLNIYVSEWKDEFEHNSDIGEMVVSSSIEQTEYYSYTLSLDLYNSSSETKIMRNIEVVFMNGKEELCYNTPKDDSTKRVIHPIVFYDDILPINIPPKSIVHINLHNGFWNENGSLDFIWRTTHLFLRYVDEKNTKRKTLIKRENYKSYFVNHAIE